jgi:hypothetical protein
MNVLRVVLNIATEWGTKLKIGDFRETILFFMVEAGVSVACHSG